MLDCLVVRVACHIGCIAMLPFLKGILGRVPLLTHFLRLRFGREIDVVVTHSLTLGVRCCLYCLLGGRVSTLGVFQIVR